jgi:hypothetical protein
LNEKKLAILAYGYLTLNRAISGDLIGLKWAPLKRQTHERNEQDQGAGAQSERPGEKAAQAGAEKGQARAYTCRRLNEAPNDNR